MSGWKAALIVFVLAVTPAQAAEAPRRVVSINLCSDILVALLARPETLVSVYRISKKPAESPVSDLVAQAIANDAQAEEVIAMKPDLVVADRYSSPFTVDLLKRAGINLVLVPEALSFEDTVSNVRLVAQALGREEKGEEVVARFEQRMAKAKRPLDEASPSAIYYQAMATAAAPGSQGARLLAHAGLENLLKVSRPGFGNMPVEEVIRLQPDLIVTGVFRDGEKSISTATLDHPALRAYAEMEHSELLPVTWQKGICGTPFMAGIAEELAAAHDRMVSSGQLKEQP